MVWFSALTQMELISSKWSTRPITRVLALWLCCPKGRYCLVVIGIDEWPPGIPCKTIKK